MAPKKRQGRPSDRAAPSAVADRGSARGEAEREIAQSEKEEENEKLRLEIQRLRDEIARGKSHVSSTSFPLAPAPGLRIAAREEGGEEGVSLRDFLSYGTPEFRGEDGDDPQEFLEETGKVFKRLPCSDVRAVELVGMKMKANAWDWYQQNIEDRVYSDSPPTWQEFRQAVMDEFLPPAERQYRATQFERLRQAPGMSISEYAREFMKLSKYAPRIVPTEAEKVHRFKAGLISSLYYALAATEFPTLSRAIDAAKRLERRHNEDKVEREQKKQNEQGASVQSAPMMQISYGRGQAERSQTTCDVCGKFHTGQCLWGQSVCYGCGQAGHYIKSCPQRTTRQPVPPTSRTTAQSSRGRGQTKEL